MTDDQREIRKLKKALRELVGAVTVFLGRLDEEMRGPSNYERGRRVARLSNELEMARDRVKFFTLNVGFRTGRTRRGKG